ncbi:MAG: redoxin domain-containing protein [Myxococcota bacterium]
MREAPELIVQQWLNTPEPITLRALRGRVVLIEAFQMLCPACVSHALPQAREVAKTFSSDELVILGLHTVFEHHAAQGTREALEAFLHEYRITFPVGIDMPADTGSTPRTMTAYRMQGTPTTLLIDRDGVLRMQTFGRTRDMSLGARRATLLQEPVTSSAVETQVEGCDETGCPAPNPGG